MGYTKKSSHSLITANQQTIKRNYMKHEEIRREFEVWLKENPDTKCHHPEQAAWEAWQAALSKPSELIPTKGGDPMTLWGMGLNEIKCVCGFCDRTDCC